MSFASAVVSWNVKADEEIIDLGTNPGQLMITRTNHSDVLLWKGYTNVYSDFGLLQQSIADE
ncbi:predicted protein [Sclerotinia sclerotiorum 1980 UF-70]|uniref:Uncharacterized protein n=1 Tax=Sclerotinia sclerotiorum (strain ATCC 18683 / 1980 / Ss-1) TaxID=665079 RepID=A7EC93_SCLS1|nr:predicted protein [Sclerotinia sclerotiorum 1980 UF-70]EDO00072.1 predicted protein [Sclerotinia sclerotiorum 1980 UF-70]